MLYNFTPKKNQFWFHVYFEPRIFTTYRQERLFAVMWHNRWEKIKSPFLRRKPNLWFQVSTWEVGVAAKDERAFIQVFDSYMREVGADWRDWQNPHELALFREREEDRKHWCPN